MKSFWIERVEGIAWRVLFGGLVILALMAFASVFLITLGYDEAWILSGIQDILRPRPLDVVVLPSLTNGGLLAAGELLVTALAGPQLWLQRLFCLVCSGAVIGIVWRWAAVRFGNAKSGALAVSVLLATPGMLVLGSTAYATLPAFLMVLLAALAWEQLKARHLRIFCTGIFAGLAAATRFECALLLPALCIYAWFIGADERRRNVTDALFASLLAIMVLAACIKLYALGGPQVLGSDDVVSSTGIVSSFFNYPRLLNRWVISEGFLPLPVLMFATMSALYFHCNRSDEVNRGPRPPWLLLVAFGWLAWGAWMLRAPIPHLRYVWPALASFMILLGFAVAGLHAWGRRHDMPYARIAALFLALSCVLGTIGSNARNLVFGNGDIMSWEWAGQSPRAYFTRFRHIDYQRQAADYLRESTQPNERLLAIGISRSLGYLAQRDVLEINQLLRRSRWDPAKMPKRLVMEPVVGNFIYLSDEARRWIIENTLLEAQFGPYAFYRLTGTYPADPTMLRGTTEIYQGHPHTGSYR